MLGLVLVALSGCWEERDPCTHWAGKLAQGLEPQVAVKQLADHHCVGARPVLLAHLDDPGVGADVFATLVGLGRSLESEAAVRRALKHPEMAAEAARVATEWKLAAAEPELRAAVADPALVRHRDRLLAALLAVAPAERSVASLAPQLADSGAMMERALEALTKVEWQGVPASERAAIARALMALAARAGLSPERVGVALRELGRIPLDEATRAALGPIDEALLGRARAGDRAALLAAWCVGADGLAEIARPLVDRPGVEPGARALAAAIDLLAGGPTVERVGAAPADDDVALALALAGGEALAPAFEVRVEGDKGAARASFARGLAVALPPARLAAWQEGLRKSPSLLLRGIPDEPPIAAVIALMQRCGDDAACHRAAIDALLPKLSTLDAEVAAARAAVKAADEAAQATVAKDAARAQELARVTGDGLAAAKVELEQIAARRDAAFVPVRQATAELGQHLALPLAVIVSLRHLPPESARSAAEALLAACRGEACGTVRGWAAVALGDHQRACLLEAPAVTP